jgi:hypothetical protein
MTGHTEKYRERARGDRLVWLAICAGMLAGCASDGKRDGLSTAEFANVHQIAIYDAGSKPRFGYQMLDEIQGTSCNLTPLPPNHPGYKVVTEYEALYDMKLEAADLGADAIVDVSCRHYGYGLSHSCYESYVCSGSAVAIDDGVGMGTLRTAVADGDDAAERFTTSPAVYQSLIGFTPDYLTEDQRATLGNIAVAMPHRSPGRTVEAPPSGGAAAATGAGLYFLQCIGGGGTMGLIISPLCAAIGAGLGALSAEDKGTIEASGKAIRATLTEYYSHTALRDRMVRVAAESGAQDLVLEIRGSNDTPWQQEFGRWRFAESVDTVIEVGVEEFLLPAWGNGAVTNLPAPVSVRMRVRVLRLDDSRELYNRTYGFVTDKRKFSDWGAENGAALRHALERGFEQTAGRIIEDLLLAYPLMPTFGAASPGRYRGQREYVIEPVDPVAHTYWSIGSPRPAEARSLEPRFRWQDFPSTRVLQADFQGKLAGLSDLRYDLRVFRLERERSHARLVLEKNNIEATEFLVTQPLLPGAEYAWSVRARFELDTGERTTRWSGEWIGDGVKGFLVTTPR